MTQEKIGGLVERSHEAFQTYSQLPIQKRSDFLFAIVDALNRKKEDIIDTAVAESHLPKGRITGELTRTVNQIKLFANYIKDGAYLEATIDHGDPDRQPQPKPDIRRMLLPMGPVVVFGASNFPLAFSTIGGDSVSALAAGCSVIYKCHPGHPETSKLVNVAVEEAVQNSNLPEGVFLHVELDNEGSQQLVQHPLVEAVGFTGSFKAGKLLYDLAQQRPKPIPVYAEMGSVNPVFLFEEKAQGNIESFASLYCNSLCLGAGQFCTNPGLIFIPESVSDSFLANLREKLTLVEAQPMLHSQIARSFRDKVKSLGEVDYQGEIVEDELNVAPVVKVVNAEEWLSDPANQEEVFGPFGMVVTYSEKQDLHRIVGMLDGQLTITLWATAQELEGEVGLLAELQRKCGRLLFGGVPTGVEVGFAMHHGGPFPATTDSRSTSVGVYAIKRFLRPLAFQDWPDPLLPEALKEGNPLGIPRTEDGHLK
jgi:2,5-dioxopentanoate dehydrogenase